MSCYHECQISRARDYLAGLSGDAPGRDEAEQYINDCSAAAERLPEDSELRFFYGLSVRASAMLMISDARAGAMEMELDDLLTATEGV